MGVVRDDSGVLFLDVLSLDEESEVYKMKTTRFLPVGTTT